MPEGPSIVIAKEAMQHFAGHTILAVAGNSKIDLSRFENQTIQSFKSHGKHLLVCFDNFTMRVHFLMFGTYRINEQKTTPLRLGFTFSDGEINFYTCSIKILEGDVNLHYNWGEDVMNDNWNPRKAKSKLKNVPNKMACDALLEQDIFAGVGNIIKNEVLYRIKLHPESHVGQIPTAKMKAMIDQSRIYSFEFLEWKKAYVLKKHWLAHTKKTCKRCNRPMIKKYTGVKKRRSFFCENCQKLYG